MKTDYLIHEPAYISKREKNAHSWGGKEVFERTINEIKKDIPKLPTNAKMLEIGCGNGVFSLYFAEQKYVVYGMDISPAAIDWANDLKRERGLEADFRVGSVLDLSVYNQEFFDFVLDAFCLHCIIGKDRSTLLNEVFKVLKPDGYFLVNTMCNDPDKEAMSCFDPVSRCMMKNGVAGRYFGLADDILKELQDAGFMIEQHRVDQDDNPNGQSSLMALCRKG